MMNANGIEYQKREKKIKTLAVVKHRLINIQKSWDSSTHLRIN